MSRQEMSSPVNSLPPRNRIARRWGPAGMRLKRVDVSETGRAPRTTCAASGAHARARENSGERFCFVHVSLRQAVVQDGTLAGGGVG
jgi:hypothetical protein